MGGRHRFNWDGAKRGSLGHGGAVSASFRDATDYAEAVAGHEQQKARKERERMWTKDEKRLAKAKAKVTLPTLKFMK